MTNEQLSYVLKKMDLSEGKSVRVVDDLESILVENHKTVTRDNGRQHTGHYDYLVLLKCDSIDVHAYVYRKYRNQHIVSRLTNNGFLKELWPDIDSVTCANPYNYDKVKYLAEIAGYTLRKRSLIWV